MANPGTAASSHATCAAQLFDANGIDRSVECVDLAHVNLADHQLLWVDLLDPMPEQLDQVWRALQLPPQAHRTVLSAATSPELRKCGDFFWLRVVAVSGNDGLALRGRVLTLVAARNAVVSVHAEPISFLDTLRERETAGSDIGGLCAESFVAGLAPGHVFRHGRGLRDGHRAAGGQHPGGTQTGHAAGA